MRPNPKRDESPGDIVERAKRQCEDILMESHRQFRESIAFKKVARLVEDHRERWDRITKDFCDGDESFARLAMEIFRETGLSYDRVNNMPEDEVLEIVGPAMRRRTTTDGDKKSEGSAPSAIDELLKLRDPFKQGSESQRVIAKAFERHCKNT